MKILNQYLGIVFIVFVFIVFFLPTFFVGQVHAEQPQTVLSVRYEIRPNQWYQEQAKLWKKEIDRNPRNAEAWYNYYKANRYERFNETINTAEKKARLKQIVEEMGKAIPGTYQYFVTRHCVDGSISDVSDLLKAHELQSDRPDHYHSLISHYEVKGNTAKIKEFYQLLYRSQDIAPGLLDYNYNVLMSAGENGIIITNGDNDTYPGRLLQVLYGIRPDVTILNISMSTIQEYAERLLTEKGISIDHKKLMSQAKTQASGDKPKFSLVAFVQELTNTLAENQSNIPLYFALTVYREYMQGFMDDLYVVGLVYQYSKNRIDNIALLKKNIEKNFRLDYLQFDWYDEAFPGTSSMLTTNLNYVPPLLMLGEHYHLSDQAYRANELKQLALMIAEKSGNKTLIAEIEKKDF